MARFGRRSMNGLKTCDDDLQRLFLRVVRDYDCSIIQGHRTEEDQTLAYASKRSKVRWPNSKHNTKPSRAVDVVPYPINWGDAGTTSERRKAIARFYHFAGYVLRTAEGFGIKIRWGGDWDGDRLFNDQDFDDLPHWELL